MPKKQIKISDQIDYLSILDEHGNLDNSLEPDLSDSMLLKLYRAMVLGREFDARMLNLQRQGRIGTFPPITGQEAAHLGAAAILRDSDWMVPSFRETPAEIWRGRPMENVLIAYNGYNEGWAVELERNDLPVAIPVGSQILHALGIAWSMKYRKKDDVVMVFFGDGATSQGDFHEALNFAGVYNAPVVFVCQNNQWAISIPRSSQTKSKTIAQKAIAYGIKGIQVDGNDILAVYSASKEAVERARSGQGPTLIECITYRIMMHTTADDPKRYRTDEEVNIWKSKDPIKRFQKYLKDKNLLSDNKIQSINKEVKDEIQTAVEQAEEKMKQMGNPLDMFNHTYFELLPHLTEQKKSLAKELAENQKEV